MIEIIDCEQGTPEWFRHRAGLVTASELSTVMAKGKSGGPSLTRAKYMRQLAGEIITGEPTESHSNAHMERGKAMEADARNMYAFQSGFEPQLIGFIKNGRKGCSPDSLIGDNGGLEIKTALPHIQIERLISNQLPSEHVAQVQGCMWISEREWWDFVSFWPKLPMLTIRVFRDDAYIRSMSHEVDVFNAELARLVEQVRAYV